MSRLPLVPPIIKYKVMAELWNFTVLISLNLNPKYIPPIFWVIARKITPSKLSDDIAAAHGAARRQCRLEGVKHFILRQCRRASASQLLASRRSASMKFAQKFTILAVSARQPCQTQRKRAREFEILVSINSPSFASNSALRRSMASCLVFAIFARPWTSKFSNFSRFFEGLTSYYSKISSMVRFLMEKGLVTCPKSTVFQALLSWTG